MRWLQGGKPGQSGMRWDWMRATHPEAAQVLDAMSQDRTVADYDYARILAAVDRSAADSERAESLSRELVADGAGAALHPSGLRTLPGNPHAPHNMLSGEVMLGAVATPDDAEQTPARPFSVDLDTLRTSLLAVGPPGSGKTHGIVMPLVEHLSMAALTHRASLVVIDSQAELDREGWFDVTIDPLHPTYGFSLFGGTDADAAAERLALAMLPATPDPDAEALLDAHANALYACLAPYREAFGSWPTVHELLMLLRADENAIASVKEQFADSGEWADLLDAHLTQVHRPQSPVAGLIERFARLDRPALRRLFDAPEPFDLADVNGPVRVRVVLPEVEYPHVARMLTRLVVSQFVRVASDAGTNRRIFKGLVVDGAAHYVDDYAARGLQRLRANNAGLVLTARSLAEFGPDVRTEVFGASGCKAVFGGLDTDDASTYAQVLGEHAEPENTDGRGESPDGQEGQTAPRIGLTGVRMPKLPGARGSRARARWTDSEVKAIPHGQCVMTLTRPNGFRTEATQVDLRI